MRAAHFLLSAQNEPSAERTVHPFVLRVPVQKSAVGLRSAAEFSVALWKEAVLLRSGRLQGAASGALLLNFLTTQP